MARKDNQNIQGCNKKGDVFKNVPSAGWLDQKDVDSLAFPPSPRLGKLHADDIQSVLERLECRAAEAKANPGECNVFPDHYKEEQ